MTSTRPAVLLTRRVPSSIQAKLEAVCDLHMEETALTPEELREKVRGKAGLICVLTDRIDDALLDAAPDLKIEILDQGGAVLQTFQPAAARGGGPGAAGGRGGGGGGGRGRGFAPSVSTNPGLNQIVWNLRYPSATSFPNMILWGGNVTGPAAPPGTYQVRLTANGRTQTQPFQVRRHPLFKDVTDAHLVRLAVRHRLKPATLDAALCAQPWAREVAEYLE